METIEKADVVAVLNRAVLLLDTVPRSRECSIALTHIETAILWLERYV